MARQNPPAKWVLPLVVAPTTSKCIMVQVPDDPYHIAAFRGAMLALSSAYNWSDDIDHTAKDVANVWRDIVDNMDWGCESVAVQFRQPSNCSLEASFDGGETWAEIFNAYDCARGASQDEINQEIHDGVLGGGGQPGGGGGGTPETCYNWRITLPANTQWLIPIALGNGDIITVSDVSGAWWDGNVLQTWKCPDGKEYALGACIGSGATSGTDPAPSINHMRLIGHFGAEYADMYNTDYTVPDGTGSIDGYLQANDDAIADNQGSLTLSIEVCKAAGHSVTVYPFSGVGYEDFTITDGSYDSGKDAAEWHRYS